MLSGAGYQADVNAAENGRAAPEPPATIELFDLAVDPGETRNLAGTRPEKLDELRARYQALANQAVPPKLEPRAPNFEPPRVWGETR